MQGRALLDLKPDVTLGDILSIAGSLLVPLVATVWWLRVRWVRKNPFIVRLTEERLSALANLGIPVGSHYECGVGEHGVTLAVTCRQQTVANPFDIRFVERNWQCWGRFSNAPQSDIQVTSITVPEWQAEALAERDFIGLNDVSVTSNGVGGYRATTRKPKQWIVGQILWVEVEFEAKRPWQGYLSFEGRTDRRAFGRIPVTVV